MCVTVATSIRTSWFAPKLRSALERKSTSVRALARAWRPEGDPETSRRSLNRYLNKGIVPSAQIRRELAEALEIDVSEIEPSDEDEEPSTVALTLNLSSDLLDEAIRRVLEHRERVS